MNQAAFDRFGASRRWMLVPAGIFVVGAVLTIAAIQLVAGIDSAIAQTQLSPAELLEVIRSSPAQSQLVQTDANVRARLLQNSELRQLVNDDPELRKLFFPDLESADDPSVETGAEPQANESIADESIADESTAETDE